MPISIDPRTVVMDLDTKNTNELVIAPALQYGSMLQANLRVFKTIVGVKDKYKMTHLYKPVNVLQPGTDCDSWNPNVRMGMKTRELEVCDFELNGEQCADEWSKGCTRNMQGAGNDRIYMTSPDLAAILQAQAALVSSSVQDDFYKISWFADPDFGTPAYGFNYDFTGKDPAEVARLTAMMQHCKGLWYDMQTAANGGHIYGIDTNDGTAGGNALNPANVLGLFQDLKQNSPVTLQYWNMDKPSQDWPMFLVSPGIFYAYKRYLQSLGQEPAYQLIINGSPMPGVLMWEGHPVVMVPEWDMFDVANGSIISSGTYAGKSNNQRIIFAQPFSGSNSSLIVQTSPVLKDKGKVFMYMGIRIGAKFAYKDLISVGWNSSTTFQ
jgi:hypothetical protein